MTKTRFRHVSMPLCVVILSVFSHSLAAQDLERYIKEGLTQNLSFRQQKLMMAKAAAASREARGGFFPSLTLTARASELYGNVINLGAFINPAYAALNQVTGSSAFPTDLDIRLPLQRETALQFRQAVFQPKVYFNYMIKERLKESSEAEIEAKARELILAIKVAYFNMAKADKLIALYGVTLPLLEENLRVSQSLVRNGKATQDIEFRAIAELAEIKQKRAEAIQLKTSAVQYFNFLLNRPIEHPIEIDSTDRAFTLSSVQPLPSLEEALTYSQEREEYRQLKKSIDASKEVQSLFQSDVYPTLSLGIDYGFQGTQYDFRFSQDFAIFSLNLQWNLFNGFQDQSRREQAEIETNRLNLQQRELEKQISLQVRTLYETLILARSLEEVAEARVNAAQASFDLITKRFSQGQASLIDYLDAQTTFTNAGINIILIRYDALIKSAELERASARLPLEPYFSND